MLDEKAKVTIKQLSDIQHALGGKIEKRTFRNHFNTGINDESWDELVKIGFAIKKNMGQLGGITYFVTDKAIEELKNIIVLNQ